jgi:type II secretory pathway pseudopilin PulG
MITEIKHQAGYSLIELGVALAIVATVILVALSVIQTLLTSNKVNQQVKNTTRLISKLSNLYSGGSTLGVTQLEVVRSGGWSSQFADTAGNVKTAFGGVEHLVPNDNKQGVMPANTGFVNFLKNVPAEACVDLVKSMSSLPLGIGVWNENSTPSGYNDGVNMPTMPDDNVVIVKPVGGTYSSTNAVARCTSNNSNNGYLVVLFLKP